jgi:hypothetical protein
MTNTTATPEAAAIEMAAERIRILGFVSLRDDVEAEALREQALYDHRAARD